MDGPGLRAAFTDFWTAREHAALPSGSLIPAEPSLLFTSAGMVQFLPVFLGLEKPPAPRVTTIQKCVRAGGKHNDLDDVGRSNRHFTFFEMMGNFSFGDYFKESAIPWGWEFVTDVLGLSKERLWVTVHESDDDADNIWRESVGLPVERIKRLGSDNWWSAGEVGPCGPSSEIFYDLGEHMGAGGGPAVGDDERFVEIWNLVFMQHERDEAGDLRDLPAPGIDTGAGFERLLSVLQGGDSIFDIDIFKPLIDTAQALTATVYGDDDACDVSLRILAEHARTMTFLVSDGIFPSNEERGYVLRRIIRRAIRHAYLVGTNEPVTGPLVDTTVEVMGDAYPDLIKNHSFVREVVVHEEERFRRTLETGSRILETAVADLGDAKTLAGDVAFQLHDTYGFPFELTTEILGERGLDVDRDGFDSEMAAQRARAREAGLGGDAAGSTDRYREVLDQFGVTDFVREDTTAEGRVLAVLDADDGEVEVFLDRTPFYAESGGQIGDTGELRGDQAVGEVLDCTYALPGLHRHLVRPVDGNFVPGQVVTASVDAERRDAIRRNHTGTHVLHWALREVLGEHVKQSGSHVAPDRLRFDFSHYSGLTDHELVRIEDLCNNEILANHPVRHYETTWDHAKEVGAIAFFGEKYGDIVRVLEAGPHSIELCGGTHVRALGDIGHMRIVSEGSIGSNLRRLEAITGTATIERLRSGEETLRELAELLATSPEEVLETVRKRLDEVKDLRSELRSLQSAAAGDRATELAAAAVDGVVVARIDGVVNAELKDLAVAVRDQPSVRAVVLGGTPDGKGVALVSAIRADSGLDAAALVADAAKAVKGGGGKGGDLVMAGGKDPSGIDEALDLARRAAGIG